MANLPCLCALVASLAVIVCESAVVEKKTYCSMNVGKCKPNEHTLCKYSPIEPNREKCGVVKPTVLTDAEIKTLVKFHNDYRDRVGSGKEINGNPGPQPRAAKPLEHLKWNPELARGAQAWANQCTFGHDQCRRIPNSTVGQNVAVRGTTGPHPTDIIPDLKSMVDAWYNEVKIFNRAEVKRLTTIKGVGHYTQMVWAATTEIGCGVVRYNADKKYNMIYLVCNYAPAGNVMESAIYVT